MRTRPGPNYQRWLQLSGLGALPLCPLGIRKWFGGCWKLSRQGRYSAGWSGLKDSGAQNGDKEVKKVKYTLHNWQLVLDELARRVGCQLDLPADPVQAVLSKYSLQPWLRHFGRAGADGEIRFVRLGHSDLSSPLEAWQYSSNGWGVRARCTMGWAISSKGARPLDVDFSWARGDGGRGHDAAPPLGDQLRNDDQFVVVTETDVESNLDSREITVVVSVYKHVAAALRRWAAQVARRAEAELKAGL